MKIKIKLPWDKLQAAIDAQTTPNRLEAIAAIKDFWMMDCNRREREKNIVRAEDPAMWKWVYCDHQKDDFERIERLARKSPEHHLYARNVIRYGIEINNPLVHSESAMQLIKTLLDDNLRPKRPGKQKIVGVKARDAQIALILRILLNTTTEKASPIKRCVYINTPSEIMRPLVVQNLTVTKVIKRNLYSTATNASSTNNAFDIVACATGLGFDVVRNAWKSENKHHKAIFEKGI